MGLSFNQMPGFDFYTRSSPIEQKNELADPETKNIGIRTHNVVSTLIPQMRLSNP